MASKRSLPISIISKYKFMIIMVLIGFILLFFAHVRRVRMINQAHNIFSPQTIDVRVIFDAIERLNYYNGKDGLYDLHLSSSEIDNIPNELMSEIPEDITKAIKESRSEYYIYTAIYSPDKYAIFVWGSGPNLIFEFDRIKALNMIKGDDDFREYKYDPTNGYLSMGDIIRYKMYGKYDTRPLP